MSRIIIDASIFIAQLRGISHEFEELSEKRISHNFELLIPYVVIAELFAGREAKRKLVREKINTLIKDLEFVGLTVESAKKTGELMRIYRQIPDPIDLIISAIAIEQKAKIATHNKKHFKQIKGIDLFEF